MFENFGNLTLYVMFVNMLYYTHETLYGVEVKEAIANFFFRVSVLTAMGLFNYSFLSANSHIVMAILVLPPHLLIKVVRRQFNGFGSKNS